MQMLTLLPLECLLERGEEHLGWITTKPIITINNTHVLQTVCGRKEGEAVRMNPWKHEDRQAVMHAEMGAILAASLCC